MRENVLLIQFWALMSHPFKYHEILGEILGIQIVCMRLALVVASGNLVLCGLG